MIIGIGFGVGFGSFLIAIGVQAARSNGWLGDVPRPRLPLQILISKPSVDCALGLGLAGSTANPEVTSVVPGGLMERAGFLVKDQISTVNGELVTGSNDAIAKLKAANEQVAVVIMRESVNPPMQPAMALALANSLPVSQTQMQPQTAPVTALQITISKPSVDCALGLGLAGAGVNPEVTSVVLGGLMERAGFLVKDQISTVNGEFVTGSNDAIAKLKAANGEVAVMILRESSTQPAMAVAVGVVVPQA